MCLRVGAAARVGGVSASRPAARRGLLPLAGCAAPSRGPAARPRARARPLCRRASPGPRHRPLRLLRHRARRRRAASRRADGMTRPGHAQDTPTARPLGALLVPRVRSFQRVRVRLRGADSFPNAFYCAPVAAAIAARCEAAVAAVRTYSRRAAAAPVLLKFGAECSICMGPIEPGRRVRARASERDARQPPSLPRGILPCPRPAPDAAPTQPASPQPP